MSILGSTTARKDDRLRRPISGIGAWLVTGLLLLGVYGVTSTNRLNLEVAERFGGFFVCALLPLGGIMAVVALSRKDFLSKSMGCSTLLALLWILVMLPGLSLMLGKHETDHALCQYHLATMGRTADGEWPPLEETAGDLSFPLPKQDSLRDRWLLQCPRQIPLPGLLDLFNRHYYEDFPAGDTYYWYLGHLITNEAEGLAFVKAYRYRAEHGLSLSADFEPLNEGEPTVYRLTGDLVTRRYGPRPSTAAEYEAWPPCSIPVMVERPKHKWMGKIGGCVLYLDGSVRWLPYPGGFPMTEPFIHALESLDALKKSP
jgi:hypothetical protein